MGKIKRLTPGNLPRIAVMKRLLIAGLAVLLVVAAVVFSRQNPLPALFQIAVEERNPWTHLQMNNNGDDFQFLVVSDRTGGHRAKVFSRAVDQINLLQPEFVLSVGDLIEGYTDDEQKMADQWREFQGYVSRLQMPFFYVPGNHDLTNKAMEQHWKDKFGRRYYHFVYKNVMFLILCSEDPPGSAGISKEQIEYVNKALADNPNVRWTIVALHQPIWTAKDLDKNGWAGVEKALAGRNYTVFAGHVHRYQKFVRQGMNYYQLSTTGGSSRLRGVPYGEFDHVVWVTLKKEGPVLANILLDGVLPENLRKFDSEELAMASERKPTYPVRGTVHLEGVPCVGAWVAFYTKPTEGKKPAFVADAVVEADGSFSLSSYTAFDGGPVGDYLVAIRSTRPYDGDSFPKAQPLPERYADPEKSGLTAAVKAKANEFKFELKRD
jgi:hypothetical protein